MATKTAPAVEQKWMSVRAAIMATGIKRDELLRRAAMGQVRVQALPGVSLKLNAEDVARLAGEAK